MLTVSGVRFFHPLSSFKIKGFIRTGGVFEWIFFVVLVVGVIFYIFKFLF